MKETTLASETFSDGTERTYLDDGSIVVIVSSGDVRREALDVWGKVMVEAIHAFAEAQHIYMVLDVTRLKYNISPYARTKAMEILHAIKPHQQLYTAVVMEDKITNKLLTMVLKSFTRLMPSKTNSKFVTNHESGLQWLREERDRRQSVRINPSSNAQPTS